MSLLEFVTEFFELFARFLAGRLKLLKPVGFTTIFSRPGTSGRTSANVV